MDKMDKTELNKILEKHKRWLGCKENGERANLYGADLRGANLYGAKNIPFIPYSCPEYGSFIGYKKAIRKSAKGYGFVFLTKAEAEEKLKELKGKE